MYKVTVIESDEYYTMEDENIAMFIKIADEYYSTDSLDYQRSKYYQTSDGYYDKTNDYFFNFYFETEQSAAEFKLKYIDYVKF